MRDYLSRFAVPGQDPTIPVISGNDYLVYDPRTGIYAGKVRTEISDDGLTVKNRTLPGHTFYDGRITRTAYQDAFGNWLVTTHGIGNNKGFGDWVTGGIYADINAWQGPYIFSDMDRAMGSAIRAHHAKSAGPFPNAAGNHLSDIAGFSLHSGDVRRSLHVQ